MTYQTHNLSTSKRLDCPVSLFASVETPNNGPSDQIVSLRELFERHSLCDDLKEKTQGIRYLKESSPKKYGQRKKAELGCFRPGSSPTRGQIDVTAPLFLFDIDGCTPEDYQRVLTAAPSIDFLYRLEQSVGGGCRLYVWVVHAEKRRKEAYLHIAGELSRLLAIPLNTESQEGPHLDTKTSDAKRLWFECYTPPDLVYFNEDSRVFRYEAPESTATTSIQPSIKGSARGLTTLEQHRNNCERLIEQIERDRFDITATMGVTGDWFALACALVHTFGVADGGNYFKRVSRFYPNYSEAEAEDLIKQAAKKNNGAIGWFYEVCKAHGYRFKDTFSKGLASREEQRTNIDIQIIPAKEMEHQKMREASFNEDNFWCEDNRYYVKKDVSVSNFIFSPPLILLQDASSPKRILNLINYSGDEALVCCPVKTLSNRAEFSALVEGKGSFVPNWTRDQFAKIKEYIYDQEDIATEVSTLGFQPASGYYAFSNAIFDGTKLYLVNEFGICQIEDEYFYLPAFSKVNEDAEMAYHNERKFIYEGGKVSFEQWSKQLVTVFGKNAVVGISFVIAAAFRDIIFSQVGCFPMLFLFGPKGTGKTTFRNALHRLFGNYGPNDAIGLGSASSPKGFARKLAQVRNSLQPFEEYKNRINNSLIEMLKNIYDGIGYERAQTTNDNRTHATLVNSAVILGGQEMPTKENALFSRVIMLTFSKTSFSAEAKECFRQLEEQLAEGMGNVLLEILRHRPLLVSYFQSQFNVVYGHLRQDPDTQQMEERTLTNMAAILTPVRVLEKQLALGFDYKEAYRTLKECIKLQHSTMQKTNEINQFWDIVEFLNSRSFINDRVDYRKTVEGEETLLSLNLNAVFPLYYEHGQKQNINVLDKPTLTSYLAMQPYFKQQRNGRKDKPVRLEESGSPVRCMQFYTELMGEAGIDFLQNLGSEDESA